MADPQPVVPSIGTTTFPARRLMLLIAAFAVGAVGIWLLREPWAKTAFWPWLILLLAMCMGGWGLQRLELWLPGQPVLPRLADFTAPLRRRVGLACLGLMLLLTAWLIWRLWPDYHKWHGTPPIWIAVLILAVVGPWLLGAVGHAAPRAASAFHLWSDSRRNRWLEVIAFTLIFLLAIFLRVYRLDAIPPGIYVDETNGGLDGLYIAEGRDVSPFATGWYGTPNGYLYYMAGLFRLFGANWYSLKLVSLLPAILTVPAVYLLAKQLFGSLTGLIAMFLMAVSRWHLSMSRWGWNETAAPLFQVLSFYFLIRGLRDRRALDYALSGLLLGLSQYTYLSARLAALTLGLYMLYWLLSDPSGWWNSLKRSWWGFVILAVTAFAAAAPLLVTYITDPFTFGNRVSEISVFRDIKDQGSYAPLVGNITDMLKFFHQTGDLQGKHNLPGEPMTDPFTGLLFAIGVAYAIYGWRDQRRVLLLLWLVIGLAGSFLSSHSESPQSYRSLTALPAVVLLAADVLDRSGRAAYKWLCEHGFAMARPAFASLGAGSLIMATLAGAGIWESSVYFGRQASSIDVIRGFNATENGVARETISALHAGETVYLSPSFSTFSPLRFLVYGVYKAQYGQNTLDDPPYHVVVPEVNLPVPDDGHDVFMMLDTQYWPLRGFISSLYPHAQMELVTLADNSPVYMRVRIPRSDIAGLQGLSEDLTYADGHRDTLPAQNITANKADPQITQVTWTGAIRIDHGNQYEIRGAAGMQIYLDGQPVDAPAYLGRGLYELRVVSPNGLPGDASLTWKIGNADFVPVPSQALFHLTGTRHGLLGSYWNNEDWSGSPMFHQVTPFLLLAWPDEQPIVPTGPFTARFTGMLHITDAASYQFQVNADDGARLTIDGHVLGDGLNVGQPNTFEATVELAAGDHPIQVDYIQKGGGSALRFFWRLPNQDWTPVPPEALIPAQP